jgi:hypothetical protein
MQEFKIDTSATGANQGGKSFSTPGDGEEQTVWSLFGAVTF